jgi:lipoprotein NlpI
MSDALCERARALAYLGRAAEASADIRSASQQAPGSAAVLKCSGEIHFVLGNFSQSTTDLSRALALGTSDAEIYFQRGLSYYYLKRRDEAAEDFGRSAEMAREGPLHVRAAIWRTLALAAAKPAAAPSDTAALDASGEWPAPALGLMRRMRVPDEVLREAHHETGERLEWALAEAYLYLGQYYLLTGDAIRATVFFQRSIDKGALQAFYHASARHELAQLSNDQPGARASH